MVSRQQSTCRRDSYKLVIAAVSWSALTNCWKRFILQQIKFVSNGPNGHAFLVCKTAAKPWSNCCEVNSAITCVTANWFCLNSKICLKCQSIMRKQFVQKICCSLLLYYLRLSDLYMCKLIWNDCWKCVVLVEMSKSQTSGLNILCVSSWGWTVAQNLWQYHAVFSFQLRLHRQNVFNFQTATPCTGSNNSIRKSS